MSRAERWERQQANKRRASEEQKHLATEEANRQVSVRKILNKPSLDATKFYSQRLNLLAQDYKEFQRGSLTLPAGLSFDQAQALFTKTRFHTWLYIPRRRHGT